MEEKSHNLRDHKGRFSLEDRALPAKNYRKFIEELYDKHGNITLRSLLTFYETRSVDPDPMKHVTNPTPEKPVPTLDELFKAATSFNDDMFYIMEFLPEVSHIKRIQDYLKDNLKYPWISWEKPEDFHITLMAVMYEDAFKASNYISSIMQDTMVKPVSIEFDGTDTFSNSNGENVLFLKVRKTRELQELQERLYVYAKANMLETSGYSNPESWTPHITLAYGEEDFKDIEIPPLGGVALPPGKLVAAMNGMTLAES